MKKLRKFVGFSAATSVLMGCTQPSRSEQTTDLINAYGGDAPLLSQALCSANQILASSNGEFIGFSRHNSGDALTMSGETSRFGKMIGILNTKDPSLNVVLHNLSGVNLISLTNDFLLFQDSRLISSLETSQIRTRHGPISSPLPSGLRVIPGYVSTNDADTLREAISRAANNVRLGGSRRQFIVAAAPNMLFGLDLSKTAIFRFNDQYINVAYNRNLQYFRSNDGISLEFLGQFHSLYPSAEGEITGYAEIIESSMDGSQAGLLFPKRLLLQNGESGTISYTPNANEIYLDATTLEDGTVWAIEMDVMGGRRLVKYERASLPTVILSCESNTLTESNFDNCRRNLSVEQIAIPISGSNRDIIAFRFSLNRSNYQDHPPLTMFFHGGPGSWALEGDAWPMAVRELACNVEGDLMVVSGAATVGSGLPNAEAIQKDGYGAIIQDSEALANYIDENRYGRIAVVASSFGSVLGASLAHNLNHNGRYEVKTVFLTPYLVHDNCSARNRYAWAAASCDRSRENTGNLAFQEIYLSQFLPVDRDRFDDNHIKIMQELRQNAAENVMFVFGQNDNRSALEFDDNRFGNRTIVVNGANHDLAGSMNTTWMAVRDFLSDR